MPSTSFYLLFVHLFLNTICDFLKLKARCSYLGTCAVISDILACKQLQGSQ